MVLKIIKYAVAFRYQCSVQAYTKVKTAVLTDGAARTFIIITPVALCV